MSINRWMDKDVAVHIHNGIFSSVQFSSVAEPCLTLCNCAALPGLPVHHQLPESTQTHVHWVSDAIQPSHPLLSPSPPALNLSQHQGIFQWVSCLHQVAKVLGFQLQHQSFQLLGEGEMYEKSNMETYVTTCKIDSQMGICCMAQETQTGSLYQRRGVSWVGRWGGGSKGMRYMYTYGWLMLRFDRKQQNAVKYLPFNKK